MASLRLRSVDSGSVCAYSATSRLKFASGSSSAHGPVHPSIRTVSASLTPSDSHTVRPRTASHAAVGRISHRELDGDGGVADLELGGQALDSRFVDLVVGHAAEQLLQDDDRFEARRVCADAEVHAVAEAEMALHRAMDVEP